MDNCISFLGLLVELKPLQTGHLHLDIILSLWRRMVVDEEKSHLFAFRGIQQALICCPHWGLWHPRILVLIHKIHQHHLKRSSQQWSQRKKAAYWGINISVQRQ